MTFVRQNHFKVGLNFIENRLRSILNVIEKEWLNLSEKDYKLQCKKLIGIIVVISTSGYVLTFKNVLYVQFSVL